MEYDDLGELCDLLQHPVHPYIPVGSHNGYEYRLNPSLDFLDAPLDRDDKYVDLSRTSESIVGINLVRKTKHFKDKKQHRLELQRFIEGSDGPSFTDSSSRSFRGNTATGFVCFQAGILEAALPEKDLEPRNWDWEETDWVLVVVIDDQNRAGNVWLLQNFNIYMPDSGFYTIPLTDEEDWGFFPGDKQLTPRPLQRSGVKIADRVEDPGRGREWTMDEWILGAYDLVLALIFERGEELPPVIVRMMPVLEPWSPELEEDSGSHLPSLDLSSLTLNDSDGYTYLKNSVPDPKHKVPGPLGADERGDTGGK